MNILQNKNKLYSQIFAWSLATLVAMCLILPVKVHAGGDATKYEGLIGLCGQGNTLTSIDLTAVKGEAAKCVQAGGRVTLPGDQVPAALCYLDGANSTRKLTRIPPIQAKYCDVAGTSVLTGQAFPTIELLKPGSPFTTGLVEGSTDPLDYPDPSGGKNSGTSSATPPLDTDVEADCNADTDPTSAQNCGITRYLIWFINILSGIVGVTVVAAMIVGGIQYSTSAGDPQAAAAAKQRISNALLALVAFGLMYGFLQWIVPGGVL